jgi:hypothetical protein
MDPLEQIREEDATNDLIAVIWPMLDGACPSPLGWYRRLVAQKFDWLPGRDCECMSEATWNPSEAMSRIATEPVLQQRLAKLIVLACFRNSGLEDLHASISPCSATGDYTDVW